MRLLKTRYPGREHKECRNQYFVKADCCQERKQIACAEFYQRRPLRTNILSHFVRKEQPNHCRMESRPNADNQQNIKVECRTARNMACRMPRAKGVAKRTKNQLRQDEHKPSRRFAKKKKNTKCVWCQIPGKITKTTLIHGRTIQELSRAECKEHCRCQQSGESTLLLSFWVMCSLCQCRPGGAKPQETGDECPTATHFANAMGKHQYFESPKK